MSVSVEIAVKGQLGDLSFEASHDAVGSASKVFFLADKASHAGRRTLQSIVAGLPDGGRYGAVVRYLPLSSAVGADAAAVVDVVLAGIEEIEDASEPRIPTGYDVAMTESVARLAERLRGGIQALDLTAINGERGRRAYQVVRVEVERIDRLPDNHELPSIETLFGSVPTFTGGIAPAEYVRTMRDDD